MLYYHLLCTRSVLSFLMSAVFVCNVILVICRHFLKLLKSMYKLRNFSTFTPYDFVGYSRRRYTDCRQPSVSYRHCPHREWPAMSRHVRIISACFPKPSEDAPLPAFFAITFVQCLRSDSCHYWHSERIFYLLTYLEYQSSVSKSINK